MRKYTIIALGTFALATLPSQPFCAGIRAMAALDLVSAWATLPITLSCALSAALLHTFFTSRRFSLQVRDTWHAALILTCAQLPLPLMLSCALVCMGHARASAQLHGFSQEQALVCDGSAFWRVSRPWYTYKMSLFFSRVPHDRCFAHVSPQGLIIPLQRHLG